MNARENIHVNFIHSNAYFSFQGTASSQMQTFNKTLSKNKRNDKFKTEETENLTK